MESVKPNGLFGFHLKPSGLFCLKPMWLFILESIPKLWVKGVQASWDLVSLRGMASWEPQDLIKEIHDMEMIFVRSKGSDILDKLKSALVAKVEATHLISPSSYVQLMDALDKSTLPSDMKSELEKSFEHKTAAGVQGHLRLRSSPQSMVTPFNYLSASEWKQIESVCNTVDAAHICIKRMKLCGLKSLKEDSKKHLTAFLVTLQMKTTHVLPPSAEMYKLSNFIRATFSAMQVQSLVGGLASYPPSPYDLGEATWAGVFRFEAFDFYFLSHCLTSLKLI